MLKKYKWSLLFSSLVLLLPGAIWLFCENRLPDGSSGSRAFGAGLSLIFLAFQWLCILLVLKDPKNREQNPKVLQLAFWILPMVSIGIQAMIMSASADSEKAPRLVFVLLGLLFSAFGLILPFCRPNRTIGIRVCWTLADEDNWNATHMFGGRIFLAGGILMLLSAALPLRLTVAVCSVCLFLSVVLPILYSYRYAKKHRKTHPETPVEKKNPFHRWSAFFAAFVLILATVLLFSGKVTLEYKEDSLTLDTTVWSDLTIPYADIHSIAYRPKDDIGVRTNGFGGLRFQAGAFRNDEFGSYTRYSYNSCHACIILRTENNGVVVVNGENQEKTEAIYRALLDKTAGVEKRRQ